MDLGDDPARFSQICLSQLLSSSSSSSSTPLAGSLAEIRAALSGKRDSWTPELRKRLEAERKMCLDVSSTYPISLNLAVVLAFSTCRAELHESLSILGNLMQVGDSKDHEEYSIWSAVAHYHLGEYRSARLVCEAIILQRSSQFESLAQALLELNRSRVNRDGLSGLGMLAFVVVAATLVGTLLRN